MIYQHLNAKKSELDKLPVLPADAQEELRKKSRTGNCLCRRRF